MVVLKSVVHCGQDAGSVFKVFAAFAIEFYPGISHRFSAIGWFPIAGYARLEYGDNPGGLPVAAEHPPESWHPEAEEGVLNVTLYESYGPDYETVWRGMWARATTYALTDFILVTHDHR